MNNKIRIDSLLRNKSFLLTTTSIVISIGIVVSSLLFLFIYVVPTIVNTSLLNEQVLNMGVQLQASEFNSFDLKLFIIIITIVIAVIGVIGLIIAIICLCIVLVNRKKRIAIAYDDGADELISTTDVDTISVSNGSDKGLS